MYGIQLSQGWRVTTRREFTFYYYVPGRSWYSLDRPWKDERVNRPLSRPVVLIPGPLD